MQLMNLIISDIKIGMKNNIVKFIIAFLFALVCCGFLYQSVEGKILGKELSDIPGFYDFFLYIFGGMKKYKESQVNIFNVPVIWMGVQLLVSSCIFSYPVRNIYDKGNNILMLYRSRTEWWMGKNAWTILQVVCIYASIVLGIVVSTLVYGSMTDTFSQEITYAIHGVVFQSSDYLGIWFVVLPFMYSIMAAVCQINLSLIVEPIYALIIVVVYQVLSAYVQSPLLLANYSMLLRQNIFVAGGVNAYVGIAAEIVVSCIAVIVGVCWIRKKDVL